MPGGTIPALLDVLGQFGLGGQGSLAQLAGAGAIIRSRYPAIQAAEALGLIVPLYLIGG